MIEDLNKRARYSEVERRLWRDQRFRKLSPIQPCGQGLWLYLLTTPELCSMPGLIMAGEAAMAEDLDWPLEAFRKAFREVLAEGMAEADWKARLVVLPKAIQRGRPQSPNVIVSWRLPWIEAPECALKSKYYRALKAHVQTLGESFREAFAKAVADPSPNQDQDQDQEQKTTSAPRPMAEQPPALGSPEATALLERLSMHADVFGSLNLRRIAEHHAAFMFNAGQRLGQVLDAIDDCAAKLPDGLTAEARQSRLVGFMRKAHIIGAKVNGTNGAHRDDKPKNYEAPKLTKEQRDTQKRQSEERLRKLEEATKEKKKPEEPKPEPPEAS